VRTTLKLFCLIGLSLSAFSQSNTEIKPLLFIDAQGHSGSVTDMAFTTDGNTLISVSLDKTIRLWDIHSGALVKSMRTHLGSGSEGAIYTMAISPDNKYLAIGGYFPEDEIRLINLEKESDVLILKGHNNVINKLTFNRTGKLLASASSDNTVKIWDISFKEGMINGKLLTSYNDHSEKVYDIAFSPDSQNLVSASADGTLILHEIDGPKAPVLMKMHMDKVFSCAYSPDGNYIVSGGSDGQLIAWNQNGTFKSMLDKTSGPVFSLSFSANGHIYAASKEIKILTVNGTSVGIIPSEGTNTTASAIHGNKYFAAAISSSGSIKVLDIEQTQTLSLLSGEGVTPKQLATNNNGLIAIGDKNQSISIAFDLTNFKYLFTNFDKKSFVGSITEENGYSLTKMDDYTLSTGFKGSIKNDPGIDGRILRYTILDDSNIAVGSDFSIKIYSRDGVLKKTLRGANGAVTSLAVDHKYNYLITANTDQVVRVWNIASGENIVSFYFTKKNDWICWTPNGYYEASSGGEKYLGWHVNQGINKTPDFYPAYVFAKSFHQGELVKETIRLGSEKEAKAYLNINKERISQNQVNVLTDAPEIKWISPEIIKSEANTSKIRIKAAINSQSDIKSVKILINGRPAPQARGESGLKEISKTNITLEQDILLLNEINRIKIFVSNEHARKVSEERVITIDKTKLNKEQSTSSSQLIDYTAKPNLFVLGIGVSEYANSSYNLTFADDDAESITNLFGTLGKGAYQSVHVEKITNADATKQKILNSFAWLKQHAGYKDVVVVFIASHGFNEANDFYILPHDGNTDRLKETAINWSNISGTLGSMPSKVLLLIDACHSGQLGSDIRQQGSNNTEAVRKISDEENGVVIMAASTGDETSKEYVEWGHGAFTLSVLEGLELRKANIKDDLTIFLRELDFYVSERTVELTSGQQHPTTQKPSSISRFPILNIDN
jgi:WD40 repeat protein